VTSAFSLLWTLVLVACLKTLYQLQIYSFLPRAASLSLVFCTNKMLSPLTQVRYFVCSTAQWYSRHCALWHESLKAFYNIPPRGSEVGLMTVY
jgi:hypothetical protein